MKMNKNAFTLTELVIALSIIVVLGAIGIPMYTKYKIEAKRTEAAQQLTAISNAQQAYRGMHGSFTGDITELLFDRMKGETYYFYHLINNVSSRYGTANKEAASGGSTVSGSSSYTSGSGSANLKICFTAHANGQIDSDGYIDNLNISEKGILCNPDNCSSLNTHTDCSSSSFRYMDDVKQN